MEQLLRLFVLKDNVSAPFPNAETQIHIPEFTYTAQRMGGAPSITCSIRSSASLEELWDTNIYTEFNGEKFFIKRTPTSAYDNTDSRYNYDMEFVSERVVLETTLFYDVVKSQGDTIQAFVISNTDFQFFGTIQEFITRLNASLSASKLNYKVVAADNTIKSEGKMVQFKDKYVAEALQEIYNVFEFPYYFRTTENGKHEIVVGNNSSLIIDGQQNEVVFKYGSTNSLIGITKTNANNGIVNRITGYGSDANIPYYYPNETPKGSVELVTSDLMKDKIVVTDLYRFAQAVDLNEQVTYKLLAATNNKILSYATWRLNESEEDASKDGWYSPKTEETFLGRKGYSALPVGVNIDGKYYEGWWTENTYHQRYRFRFKVQVQGASGAVVRLSLGIPNTMLTYIEKYGTLFVIGKDLKVTQEFNGRTIECQAEKSLSPTHQLIDFTVLHDPSSSDGTSICDVVFEVINGPTIITDDKGHVWKEESSPLISTSWHLWLKYTFAISNISETYGWNGNNRSSEKLDTFGLAYADGYEPPKDPKELIGQWFGLRRKEGTSWITPQKNLMPSIYRATNGSERFYNALNNTYDIYEDEVSTGQKYEFPNPFVSGYPKEHIQPFEDIKPTIVGMRNAAGQPLNSFLEVAFDDSDNDETDEDGNYLHPYFFAKLPKFDGEGGFNIFEHAVDEAEMTISMLDGHCGGCEFVIGVTSDTQKNSVQVRKNTNGKWELIRDKNGNVSFGKPQDVQNNTQENEVWVALKKDISSYNQIMPNRSQEALPKVGDSFTLLHIDLPHGYIVSAERRLEHALIKYMFENNIDKFTFNIKFSRIYLAENPEVLAQLNENSTIKLMYEGHVYELHTSSFTYSQGDDIIPEITINVSDSIQVNKNFVETALAPIKADFLKKLADVNHLEGGAPYFLRKDVNDSAQGKIHFVTGTTFDIKNTSNDFKAGIRGVGAYKEGDDWYAETDYLKVRKKMTVEQLEIASTTYVDGKQVLSSARAVLGFVIYHETEKFWRCYFKRVDSSGRMTVNKWRVGDQAYCNTFDLAAYTDENNKEVSNHFLWRRVVGVSDGSQSGSISINDTTYNITDYHYIDLSEDNAAAQSDAPLADDIIVQLGYQDTDDKSRQNAIVLAGAGEGSPYIAQYIGINSFSMPKPVTQIKPNDNLFTGKAVFEAGSSGLGNIEEWAAADQKINAASSAASAAQKAAKEAKTVADAAKKRMDKWVEDGIITPMEKQGLQDEAAWIASDRKEIEIQVKKYNIEDSNFRAYNDYIAAYLEYSASLENIIKDTSETISASKYKLTENQSTFYNARATLLERIANAAKEAVDAAMEAAMEAKRDIFEAINKLESGYNIVRNSGFTGDYSTVDLDTDTDIEDESSMFSPNLTGWTADNASVTEDKDAASEYKVQIAKNGYISQEMYCSTKIDTEYIVSMRVKSDLPNAVIKVSVGGSVIDINATNTPTYQHVRFLAVADTLLFEVTSNENVEVSDISVIQGNIQPTRWQPSPFDNRKEQAQYETLLYLKDLMQVPTTIDGGMIQTGVVNSGFIRMGKYNEDNKFTETAGISGLYSRDSSVAYYAGGNFEQAINTIAKYEQDPLYVPTQEELANMAKVAITHGGRAILQDVILRGYIYAEGGYFRGTIDAVDGIFRGGINVNRGNVGVLHLGRGLAMTHSSNRDGKELLECGIDDDKGIFMSYVDEYDNDVKYIRDCSFGVRNVRSYEIVFDENGNQTNTMAHSFIEGIQSYCRYNKVTEGNGLHIGIMSDVKVNGSHKSFALYCPHGESVGIRTFTRILGKVGTVPEYSTAFELELTDSSILVGYTSKKVILILPKVFDGSYVHRSQEIVVESLGAQLEFESIEENCLIYGYKQEQGGSTYSTEKRFVRLKFYHSTFDGESKGIWKISVFS